MAGYGIQQFDAPGILSVYQGQKDRRVNEMLLQRKIAAEDRELAKADKLVSNYRRLDMSSRRNQQRGGDPISPQGGGLADGYARPPATQAPATMPYSDANIPQGSPLSPAPAMGAPSGMLAPYVPVDAPVPADNTPAQQRYLNESNEAIIEDTLQTVGPREAMEMRKMLADMDGEQIAAAQERAQNFAKVALHLTSFPTVQARQAELARLGPDLAQMGFTPEAISKADLTDQGLQWGQVHGMEIDKLIARQQNERDYQLRLRGQQSRESDADRRFRLSQQRENRVEKWGPQAVIIGGDGRQDNSDLDY